MEAETKEVGTPEVTHGIPEDVAQVLDKVLTNTWLESFDLWGSTPIVRGEGTISIWGKLKEGKSLSTWPSYSYPRVINTYFCSEGIFSLLISLG